MTSHLFHKIAVLRTYVPRQCGIATFTRDLVESLAGAGAEVDALAVEDLPEPRDYPSEVARVIGQQSIEDYVDLADWINSAGYDMISVQHEFGIYGGASGSHLIAFLRSLKVPVATTLHTLLERPTQEQRDVLNQVIRLSDRLVVMTLKGVEILREVYGVNPSKIAIVPHGIPSTEEMDSAGAKERLNLEGRKVLMTFGLISPGKGIEDVISSLPPVVEANPDLLYLVVGATHPCIRARDGEAYRESLVELAEGLGIGDNIRFEDRFVSIDELTERLAASDIYITPYPNKEQVTSGTLAYAFGFGNAVVSTPYWHAEELLSGGKGILVPFRDKAAFTQALLDLLKDTDRLEALKQASYELGKDMQWPRIGERYMEEFRIARLGKRRDIAPAIVAAMPLTISGREPVRPSLRHLQTLYDDVGIVQHGIYGAPNREEGYCLDDNVRAAMVLQKAMTAGPEMGWIRRAVTTSLSFTHHALDKSTGLFRNFMSYDRRWIRTPFSQDAHARAIWMLGTLYGASGVGVWREFSRAMLDRSLVPAMSFTSPRSIAFMVLGLVETAKAPNEDIYSGSRLELADRLHTMWVEKAEAEWPWLEDNLTYDNARIPQALIAAGRLHDNPQMVQDGLLALEWLMRMQSSRTGNFRPIGSESFCSRGQSPSIFDQQPVEAWASVDACLAAYEVDPVQSWMNEATRACEWFFGQNDLGLSMVDFETGGCFDGLTPSGPNLNQGAESAISLFGAMSALQAAKPMSGKAGTDAAAVAVK